MSKNQCTGTATQPQCNRKFCQFNNDQYCIDEHAGQEVKSTEQKADVKTEPSVHVSDTAAHTEGDDDIRICYGEVIKENW